MTRICIVCAHPDDEILGVGGTIARLVKEGHEVRVVVMVHRSLANETEEARKILGYTSLCQCNYKDQRLETYALQTIIGMVEDELRIHPADVVYTHHSGDLNLDHRIVSQAVLTATRPQVKCPVKEVYTFETPSSTEWGFGQIQPVFQPNVFVDVDSMWTQKVKAWQCYPSEMRDIPHPRSITRLAGRAEYWGAISGLKMAEAFQLVRSVR